MIRNRMRILFMVLILFPTGFTRTPHVSAANRETGNEHWAGDLTIVGFGGMFVSHIAK